MIVAFTYQFQKMTYINLFRTLEEAIVLYNNSIEIFERLKMLHRN